MAIATVSALSAVLKGLADDRIASALQRIHAHLEQGWTVQRLAEAAALSRSAFFDRFQRIVGMAPTECLFSWRMAVANDLLRRETCGIASVAERVGHSSASTCSTAITRYVGRSPAQFARVRSPGPLTFQSAQAACVRLRARSIRKTASAPLVISGRWAMLMRVIGRRRRLSLMKRSHSVSRWAVPSSRNRMRGCR